MRRAASSDERKLKGSLFVGLTDGSLATSAALYQLAKTAPCANLQGDGA